MNLQIVHKSERRNHDCRAHEATFGYPASSGTAAARVGATEHPVALAVVTVCHAENRRAVAALVADHMSLVEILVSERIRTLPHHVNRDDLVSAGMMALVLSADAYDADRGASFRSFAALRIRGALIDELRGMDWASRSVRSRAREIETVTRQLTMTLERSPSAAEIAAKMGIGVRELDAINADLARGTVISLQGFAPETLADVLADHSPGPESTLLRREQLGYLHDAVESLSDRLRTVVEAYLLPESPDERDRRRARGHPVAGVANVLGSRSRCCATG